ncbi:MAG: HupE/UreJ family protein [Nevskia sp.]|nr:HupE/UreJ family protein [Nevskia sp.]
MRRPRALLLALSLLLCAGTAQAHKASTSYLQLRVDGAQLSGRWDIALRDLDVAIGLDANGDGALTWGEVRNAAGAIEAYALSRLQVEADGQTCHLAADDVRIVAHSDGRYAVLALSGACARPPQALALNYRLLFDVDALHRGLLRLDFHGVQSGVFAPDERELHFSAGGSGLATFVEYLRAGLFHVWTGLDHMLFLAGLFLPAVLRRNGRAWIAAPGLGPALRETAVMVTAFTLAHACTLTLAATGAFTPPARLVESAVAATVLFAGFNNLVPMVHRKLLYLAGAFGLVHGAAIAGALIELGLPAAGRVWALLAFNIGVEIAQLSVLAAVLPAAFLLRRSHWYRRLVLLPGSALVSVTGLIWLLERGAGLSLGVPLP